MINNKIAEDIIRYGQSKSILTPETINTGFLSYVNNNLIDKEDAVDLAKQSEHIVRELVNQLTVAGATPDEYECLALFQYIFDKVAEATYKTIIGEDVDTILNISEAFEYYEPDLPYSIQEQITNTVGKIAHIGNDVLKYIKDNGYMTEDLEFWFLPYLLIPVSFAIQFVLEIDISDNDVLGDL